MAHFVNVVGGIGKARMQIARLRVANVGIALVSGSGGGKVQWKGGLRRWQRLVQKARSVKLWDEIIVVNERNLPVACLCLA